MKWACSGVAVSWAGMARKMVDALPSLVANPEPSVCDALNGIVARLQPVIFYREVKGNRHLHLSRCCANIGTANPSIAAIIIPAISLSDSLS